MPIAADESIRRAQDPLAVARAHAADVVVLKVQPLGGVRACLELAERIGLPVVVSSALESSVGLAAGVALAAALPELPYACGLATAQLFTADLSTQPFLPGRRCARRAPTGPRPGAAASRRRGVRSSPRGGRDPARGRRGSGMMAGVTTPPLPDPDPATTAARVLVQALAALGVEDVVLAPGSRSAPLAYALADAARPDGARPAGAPSLRLHVRVDERSAAFLAVGLARASAHGARDQVQAPRPVAVVTTSGTAVANLHPAVLEAHHSGLPLLLLTADRPHELRGTGANQTTDQVAHLRAGGASGGRRPRADRARGRVPRACAAPSRGPWPPRPGRARVTRAPSTSTSRTASRWCPDPPAGRSPRPPA